MAPTLKAALLALLAAAGAGCLRFDEVDLFPVCEDRRAEGPSPPYTVDELRGKVNVAGPVTEDELRALFGVVRERVLTLKAAPYVRFDANLTRTPEGTWLFEAHGRGGLDPSTDDRYRFRLAPADGRARVLDEADAPHPTPAPDTVARKARLAAERTEEIADVLARTPSYRSAWLDPDLPGCAFLVYEGEGGERGEIVVNLVRERVVHVQRGST